MLSAVPVARLLKGVAAALRTHVEPHVTDRFAQMQLRAIDELLRNLAGRVEWSLTELNAEIDEADDLLEKLVAAGWPDWTTAGSVPRPRPFTLAQEALLYRTSVLVRLADAMTWAQNQSSSETVRSVVTEFLRAANDRERGRLTSGMYS